MFEGINRNSEPKEPRRRGIAAGVVAVGQRIKLGLNTPSQCISRMPSEEAEVDFVQADHPYVADVFGKLARQGGGWSELGAAGSQERKRP